MKHFLHTLGVTENASWNELRDGYHAQLKCWHPDRFHTSEEKSEAEERSKEINYAFRRIKELKADIDARAEFDSDTPFLEHYYRITEASTEAGAASYEDRRFGYNQQSFANWSTVAAKVFENAASGASRAWQTVSEESLFSASGSYAKTAWDRAGERKVADKISLRAIVILAGAALCVITMGYVGLSSAIKQDSPGLTTKPIGSRLTPYPKAKILELESGKPSGQAATSNEEKPTP